jgi:hypothetical protein
MGFFRRSNDGRHFADALLKIIKKKAEKNNNNKEKRTRHEMCDEKPRLS